MENKKMDLNSELNEFKKPGWHNESPNSGDKMIKLEMLKKEMFALRELDVTLFTQLWSLNEQLLNYREFLQEQAAATTASNSDEFSDDDKNSLPKEDSASSHDQPKKLSSIDKTNLIDIMHRKLEQQISFFATKK